jgi:CDP-glucose 4,6-dehydratase
VELRITTLASLGGYVTTIDANFWEGRRVFITGHTGFKGSWLALWLSDLGAKVYGYSLPLLPTDDFLFGEKAKQGVKSTFGDLRHLNSLVDSALASEASIVFHLGAQALVPKSFDDPVGTYSRLVADFRHSTQS